MKIIFTDLDGTLLSSDKRISKENKDAISIALKQGNKIVITTGRPLPSAIQLAKELNICGYGCYLIASNGGLIYDCYHQTVLFEIGLKKEYVRYLMDAAHKWGIHVHTYSKTNVLCEKASDDLTYYENAIHLPAIIVPSATAYINYDPWKVILIDRKSKERLVRFQETYSFWAKDKCASVFSCDHMLEYCPFQATKGNAVRFLCNYLHISLDRTIAIGDAENDISMIQAAGLGVAMANATWETKDAADIVTELDNNNNGFAEVLKKHVINHI